MTFRLNSPRFLSLSFLALALSMLFSSGVRAQSSTETHAKVQLIAEEKSVRPEKPVWVGILFQLDPGWHIYWQNPGDSGEPPKIQWRLPPGFRAGAIRWPRPILLGKGSVRDYGYEGQVLLMASLQTPPNLPASAPIEVAATVKYIVCREICIPGTAELTLSLPVSDLTKAEKSEWTALFRKSLAQLPVQLPTGWKVSAISKGTNFLLTFRGGGAQEIRFFPLQPGVIENAAPQTLDSDKDGFRLTLKKSEQLTKPVSTLRGVILLDQERAYEIAVPVKSS